MSEAKEIYILVVDDNPAIHIDFKKILTPETRQTQQLEKAQAVLLGNSIEENEFKFVIDSAYQSDEALLFIRKGMENNRCYTLTFVDIRMPPGMDGVETARHIWELDPHIQIVFCTAYTDYSWEDLRSRLGSTDRFLILKKPFENIEVQQLTNALAKKWQVTKELNNHLTLLEKMINDRTIKLTKSLAVVRATLEATSDAILVINNEQEIVDYNHKFLEMLQIPAAIIETQDVTMVRKALLDQLENTSKMLEEEKIACDFPEQEFHDVLNFKDGRVINCFSAPQRSDNKIIGRVYSFTDITKLKNMEDKILRQATHDTLTGLVNRAVLHDRLQQAMAKAKDTNLMVAVLYMDIDYFKRINEILGHEVGDEVLKAMVERLDKNLSANTTFARMGGDEFVIAIPLLEKIDSLVPLCQKLLKAISEPLPIKDQTLVLTSSIGISLYPKDGKDAVALIKNADAAVYLAKQLGRNNFQFFTMELNVNTSKRLTLESDLREALKRHEFVLHYQPLLNLKTGKIFGVEALLRWQHPKLHLIPPLEFIPIAEEIGLMLSIGDWVLETACAQNKAWQNQGLPPIVVAVNLTSKQLAQANIVEKVATILQKTQLAPEYLELELTESTIIQNTDRIIRIAQELKNIGIKLVIDDFGTGYSSLSYLNHLPVDKIKIDRSFVSYIGPSSSDVAVILAILAMAKPLKITCLAEGVETLEQLRFLRDHGCDEMQGFYYSRPEPAETLQKLLTNPKPLVY